MAFELKPEQATEWLLANHGNNVIIAAPLHKDLRDYSHTKDSTEN